MLDRPELPATTVGSAQPPVAALLGPPPLAEGEDAAAYDELLARFSSVERSALRDPRLWSEIEVLAHAIDAGQGCAQCREAARRIAAAQIDLLRARRARVELLAGKARNCELAARLAAIDRYERRALSRRKRAIRHFDGSLK